jgi:hypothetical protein
MDPRIYAGNATDLRATVALFGPPLTAEVVRSLYRFSADLFSKLGYPGNVYSISRGDSHGKYRRLTNQAERLLARDNLTGASLSYVPPSETNLAGAGWLAADAGLGQFIFDGKVDLIDLNAVVAKVVPAVASVYPATYGFGYVLDAAYGPRFHAAGIIYARQADWGKVPPLPQDEEKRCSRWFYQREDILAAGLLRDVYPLNYLTEIHSSKSLDGTPLFDWIARDPARGTLTQVRPGVWLWRVPEDRCKEVGERLQAAGLLIDPKRPYL